MARKQKREEDITDRLEKENRILKAEIRMLHRKLKKLDKDFKIDLAEASRERQLDEDTSIVHPAGQKCQACMRGTIVETKLGKSWFYRCTTCDVKGRKPD
jgi:formamidopyrimidine-DNA glycosylase